MGKAAEQHQAVEDASPFSSGAPGGQPLSAPLPAIAIASGHSLRMKLDKKDEACFDTIGGVYSQGNGTKPSFCCCSQTAGCLPGENNQYAISVRR